MPVSQVHRFLYGITPMTVEKRLWILGDTQTHDLFFHNLFHGCVSLRRTLELWALEHGTELTAFLDASGEIDFDGNADPEAAKQLFDQLLPNRTPPEGFTRRARRQPPTTEEASSESTEARAQQAANQTDDALGGQGAGLRNTFQHLAHALGNREHPFLLIVEDFHEFIVNRLELNPARVEIAQELKFTVRKKWQEAVTPSPNLVVFLTDTPHGFRFLSNEALPYPTVEQREIKEPTMPEVEASIERLALRHQFGLNGQKAIAKTLFRHKHLEVSLASIRRVVNEGNMEVTVENVLRLPPINEQAVSEIKAELDRLVGLDDLKDKVRRLETKARQFRQRLEDGESDLPEETLHLVFTGKPGTGKTTVADIVARLFHALGLLRLETVRPVTASTLMSSNVGGTRENMQRELTESLGGVLFLDEAHQFGDAQNIAAKEAVQAIVPMAWNHRHEFVIILAGYENEMHEFYKMDDGLDRRFPTFNRVHFPDYTPSELWIILERKLAKSGYSIAPEVQPRLRSILSQRSQRQGFGNAGGVDNLVAELLETHAVSSDPSSRVLTDEALPLLVRRNASVFDAAQAKLDDMVGLTPVREKIRSLIDRIEYQLQEVEEGRESNLKLHPGNMLFVGPPGTGKSTIGALIADLLFGLGAIERRICHVVSRGDLVGQFQGHSAAQVRLAVEKARDGVLFIDEAYGLSLDPRDTFGNEAVTELVRQITDGQNSGTTFILAGYEDAVTEFLNTNAGLGRRFGETIRFPNFSPADCAELVRRRLEEENYSWEDGVLQAVERMADVTARVTGDNFGNAGWVGTIVTQALDRMMSRVIQSSMPRSDANRRRLLIQDLLSDGYEEEILTAEAPIDTEENGAESEEDCSPEEVETDDTSGA